MIKAFIFDLSRVFLFPKVKDYDGELNELFRKLRKDPNFQFFDNFYLDENLLSFVELNLKDRYGVYMFTSGIIQNAPEIKGRLEEVFDKVISAEEVGLKKDNPESYKKVLSSLGLKSEEVIFVDDTIKNIIAAEKAGLNTILYKNFYDFKKKLFSDLV